MKSLKKQIKHKTNDYSLNCLGGDNAIYRVKSMVWFNISYVLEIQIKHEIINKIKDEII